MKIEIITDNKERIVLIRNDEVILISRSSARIADIVMDMLDNNGNSPLLNIKSDLDFYKLIDNRQYPDKSS